jgi:hypothetical protein
MEKIIQSKFESLVEKLKRCYDIDEVSTYSDILTVQTNTFIAGVEPDGSISVCFSVDTLPEDAAFTCLFLKDIRYKGASGKVRVGDSYFINEKDIFYGKDARRLYEQAEQNYIIERYRRKRAEELILLDDSKCFNC